MFAGGELPDLRSDYLAVTGRPPVPPRAAFGLWVSEYGFEDWGELEEVVAELLTLKAELPPGKIAAARRVAGLLAELGETSAAIDSLTATAAMAPRDADLLAQLAALQVEAGQVREARATLRRAVVL